MYSEPTQSAIAYLAYPLAHGDNPTSTTSVAPSSQAAPHGNDTPKIKQVAPTQFKPSIPMVAKPNKTRYQKEVPKRRAESDKFVSTALQITKC